MKAVLIFLLTISLHQIECQEKRILVKTLPKKVIPYSDVQILNPAKAYKVKTVSIKHDDKKYTAFPAMETFRKANIRDSLYFAQELHDRKPRVKKVLPDYVWTSLRSKRSADAVEKNKETAKTDNKNVKLKQKTKIGHRDRRNAKKRLSRHKNGTKHLQHKVKKVNHRHSEEKIQKYTIKSSKGRGKRGKSRLRSGRKSTPKGRLHHRKSGKDSKKNLTKDSARRLIAGMDAVIQDYPYVVSIQKSGQHWCAGALLNPRLVITTANCLWKGTQMSHMRVRAGSRYIHKGGQTARIQEVMKHPSWGIRRDPDNDVGLILLDKNIKFSDSVHGVDLPNRVMMPPFEDAWITSWGTDRRDGVYVNKGNTLQVYHARLIDNAKCNNITQRFGVTVTDNFICLAQTGRRAPCTRDTGAPAVSDGVLWGLASWGIRKLCGTERFPAMFSYIASQSNMDFILSATKRLMADERYYPFPDRLPLIRVPSTTARRTDTTPL